jgi:signal peptidase II
LAGSNFFNWHWWVIAGFTGYTLFSKSATSLDILAYSLLLAGGVGNLVDRVMCGYVVDFMNIVIGSLRTGIFNVADTAISAGAFMLAARSFCTAKSV